MNVDIASVEKRLVAANRIGTAVTIPEIPARFKGLKILGRGATSIVLEKDEDTAIVLTRDRMKEDWLNHSSVANHLGSYQGYNKVPGMRDIPIEAYSVPKLFPLSKENASRVRKILKEFEALRAKVHYNKAQLIRELNKFVEEYEITFKKSHELAEFSYFIINYDENQFEFDLGPRQFLQDKQGNIIVNDPVASKELLDLFMKARKSKYLQSNDFVDQGLIASENLEYLSLVSKTLEAAIENVLYHATKPFAAALILKTKKFALTNALGTDADQTHNNEKAYFLSTSRSRDNKYIRGSIEGGQTGVVFNINKDWLKNNNAIKPVDYWGWGPDSKEAEDRVFTNKPEILIPDLKKAINSVHLLFNKKFYSKDISNMQIKAMNEIIMSCKRNGIPLKIYDEYKYFMTQNPLRTIGIRQYIALIKSLKVEHYPGSSRGRSASRKYYLGPLIELMRRPVTGVNKLEKRASAIRYSLVYDGGFRRQEMVTSIKADIHNSKTTDREFLIKFMKEMKRFKAKTIPDLLDKLEAKWKDTVKES